MATKRAVGGYSYRDLVNRGQQASQRMKRILRSLMDEQPGPAQTIALLGRLAVEVVEIGECLLELERIGRDAART